MLIEAFSRTRLLLACRVHAGHERSGLAAARRGCGVAALLLATLLPGGPIRASEVQHSLVVRTNYFVVTGGTLRDIHHSLTQSRPWKASRQDARTDWKIRWKSRVAPSGENCRLVWFQTNTEITLTLPRLQVPEGTPPEVTTAWQRYLTALMNHEQRHVHITLEAASQIQSRVRALGPGRSCADVQRGIDDVARQLLDACKRRHEQYDRHTRHGATEGAVLPRRLTGEISP